MELGPTRQWPSPQKKRIICAWDRWDRVHCREERKSKPYILYSWESVRESDECHTHTTKDNVHMEHNIAVYLIDYALSGLRKSGHIYFSSDINGSRTRAACWRCVLIFKRRALRSI